MTPAGPQPRPAQRRRVAWARVGAVADAILSYPEDPRGYAGGLEALMRTAEEESSRPGAAGGVEGICREAAEGRRGAARGAARAGV